MTSMTSHVCYILMQVTETYTEADEGPVVYFFSTLHHYSRSLSAGV